MLPMNISMPLSMPQYPSNVRPAQCAPTELRLADNYAQERAETSPGLFRQDLIALLAIGAAWGVILLGASLASS